MAQPPSVLPADFFDTKSKQSPGVSPKQSPDVLPADFFDAKRDPYAPPADLPGIPAPKVDMKPVERKWVERGAAAVVTHPNKFAVLAGPHAAVAARSKPPDVTNPEWWDKPLASVPEPEQAKSDASTMSKVGRGAARSAAQNVSALTTPKNLAIMGGLAAANAAGAMFPPALPAVQALDATAATYFITEMAKAMPDQYKAYQAAITSGDVEGATKALTDMGLTAALAGTIAKHGIAPKPGGGGGGGAKVSIMDAAKNRAGMSEPIKTDIRVDRPYSGKDYIPGQPVDMGTRNLSPSELGATMPGSEAAAEFVQSTVLGEGKPARPSRRASKQTAEGVPEKPFDATEAIPFLPGQPVDMGVRPLGKKSKKPFDAFSVIETPKPPAPKDLGRGITMDDIAAETTRREPAPWPPQPKPPKGERFILPDDPYEAPKVTFEDVVRTTEKQQAKAKPEPAALPLLDAPVADAPAVTAEPKLAPRPAAKPAPLPLLDGKRPVEATTPQPAASAAAPAPQSPKITTTDAPLIGSTWKNGRGTTLKVVKVAPAKAGGFDVTGVLDDGKTIIRSDSTLKKFWTQDPSGGVAATEPTTPLPVVLKSATVTKPPAPTPGAQSSATPPPVPGQPPRPINPRRADQAGALRIPGRPAPPPAPVNPAVAAAHQHFAAEQARADAAKQRPGTTLKEKARALKNKAVTLLEDQMDPLTRDMKRVGVNVPGSKSLPAWKAMSNLIDKSLRSRVIASLEFERSGLKRVVDKATDITSLSQYVIARHTATLARLGLETGRDAAADARAVATLRNEIAVPESGTPGKWDYQPAMTYEQVGEAVTRFNNGLLDQYARSGLITPELAAELKAKYPHYAPAGRILEHMTDPEITGLGPINNRAVASVAAQHLIKKIKGSDAPIENPFEMTMARTEQAFADITRNDAARFFTTMAESTPELKGLVRRLKPGESVPDARKISLFENGQKVEFETTPEVAAAAKVLNVPQLGMAIKIAAAFSRVKKVGTTGMNFGFFAVNIARDPYDIYINADRGVGTRAALDPRVAGRAAKAAAHDWPTLEKATGGRLGGKNAEWDELVRGGGGFTEFDLSRQQVAEAIGRNRKDLPATPQQKVKNVVYRASQAWRTMENHFSRSEQLSRMRLYEAAKDRALAEGKSMAEAKQLAVWESNNVLPNYLRAGTFVRAFAPALPYFNAKIQGARVMRRSLMDRPVETSAKIATAVIMPTIASVVWNMSDPERRKAYMDMPEDEKNRSLIWVYGDAKKDSRGRYENAFKMPLSAGAAYLGAPFRRAVEALFVEDEQKGMAFAKEFMGTVPAAMTATFTPLDPKESALGTVASPFMAAQVAAPSLQTWMNYDLYRDAPIESTEMQQFAPAERAYDWTSGTAKTIARDVLPKIGLDTSPAKVDAWLYYTFGGAIQYAVAASDAALKAAGEIPEGVARGGRTPVGEIEARFRGVRSGKLRSDQYKLRREIKDIWSSRFLRELESDPQWPTMDRDTKRTLKNKFARKAGEIVSRLTDSDGYKAAEDFDKVKALKQMLEASKQEVGQ